MLLSQRFEPSSLMEQVIAMKMTRWLLSYRATLEGHLTTQRKLSVLTHFAGFTVKAGFKDRGCGVSILGDIQKPSGRGPGHLAVGGLG